MKIRELADKTGVSIDTIRFYEKKGLLDEHHVQRQANNYRDYNNQAIDRLWLIQQAKRLGFTLSEIQSEIKNWESNALSKAEKVELLRRKIVLIENQVDALLQMKSYLLQKIAFVEKS